MLNGSVPQFVPKLFHKRHFFPFPFFCDFVKKTRENVATDVFQFMMDGNGKKPLRIAILEFYKLNLNKRREYTVKHFKKSVARARV